MTTIACAIDGDSAYMDNKRTSTGYLPDDVESAIQNITANQAQLSNADIESIMRDVGVDEFVTTLHGGRIHDIIPVSPCYIE